MTLPLYADREQRRAAAELLRHGLRRGAEFAALLERALAAHENRSRVVLGRAEARKVRTDDALRELATGLPVWLVPPAESIKALHQRFETMKAYHADKLAALGLARLPNDKRLREFVRREAERKRQVASVLTARCVGGCAQPEDDARTINFHHDHG